MKPSPPHSGAAGRPTATLLIAEDDPGYREFLRMALAPLAGRIVEAADGVQAASAWADAKPDLVVTDLRMPGPDGLAFISRIRAVDARTPIVVITAHGDIPTAVEAMKRGATDFMLKPSDRRVVAGVVGELLRTRGGARGGPGGDGELPLVTASPRMRSVVETLAMARRSRVNVLIQGESGTGKEVAARAVHGPLKAGTPFLAINCAGIPEGVFESQLFGHVRGAFTGAAGDAPGLFRAAHGGTVFLDEIGEMPTPLQAKLLRVIEAREVLPVGATAPVPVDVRLIAATNRSLERLLEDGRLREDLFYRLAVVTVLLPPLRERPEDIPLLLTHFGMRCAEVSGVSEKVFSEEALARLMAHAWPGNVRELRNCVERVYVTCPDVQVQIRHLPPMAAPAGGAGVRIPTWEEAERELLRQALAAAGGNRTAAARLLDIDRKRLHRKLRRYNLTARGEPDGPESD